MNKQLKKDSHSIDLLNDSYHHHKRILREIENGIKCYDYMKVRASHRVVSHIDEVVSDLTGKTRLIIDNEVIGNFKGSKWYMEYFSISSYYRARRIAYRVFLEKLEK